jgi:hypothetical protein
VALVVVEKGLFEFVESFESAEQLEVEIEEEELEL